MLNDAYLQTRRAILKAGLVSAIVVASSGLDGLVLSASAQSQARERREPVYSIDFSWETQNLKKTDQKPEGFEHIGTEASDRRKIEGTAEDIRQLYAYYSARGIIPNVRHLYDEVEAIAQLMSRDQHYLANPENGFVLASHDALDNSTKEAESNYLLVYQNQNRRIAGVDYNLRLSVVGKLAENNNSSYKVVKIDNLFGIILNASSKAKENGQNYYEWGATNLVEICDEFRMLDGKNALRMAATFLPSFFIEPTTTGRPTMLTLDLSGTITPLTKALQRQIVYFDNEWKPIRPR